MFRDGSNWPHDPPSDEQALQLQSISTRADLVKKSLPVKSQPSWLGGFVKLDGTKIGLFVSEASKF